MKKIKKIIDWIRDNWDIPYWRCYWAWRDIRGWCLHNVNRWHWKLVKEAWCSYPFDFGFIYTLEKAKLEEMLAYFKDGKWIERSEYESYVRDLTRAIHCLDIMIDADLKPDIYVNFKNCSRFRPDLNDEDRKMIMNKFPGELRIAKAQALYYKIRLERTERWWD